MDIDLERNFGIIALTTILAIAIILIAAFISVATAILAPIVVGVLIFFTILDAIILCSKKLVALFR